MSNFAINIFKSIQFSAILVADALHIYEDESGISTIDRQSWFKVQTTKILIKSLHLMDCSEIFPQ